MSRLTRGAHVDEGVVDQNEFVEVELIGEPLSFGLMQDPLVVIVSGKHRDVRLDHLQIHTRSQR